MDCRKVVRWPDGTAMQSGPKAALLTLATYYGGPDKMIYPTHTQLSQAMCVDERSVRRRIKALEDGGLIHRTPGVQHRATVYRLNFNAIRGCGPAVVHADDDAETLDW